MNGKVVDQPTIRVTSQNGFTLIELVIIIVILGVLATVAVPRFVSMSDSSRQTATIQEMQALRQAIVGNPRVVAGGEMIDRGFEGDVGFPPERLQDLVVKPDSVPTYDPLTRLGWNGPYIDNTSDNYLSDAWSASYTYQAGTRSLISTGGSDSLALSF